MSELYSVILSGKLEQGFELAQVQENMGQAFKLSAAQIEKMFVGRPVALKRGIDKTQAVKLSQRLKTLGAQSVIKAAQPKAPVKPAEKVVAKTAEKTVEKPKAAPVAARASDSVARAEPVKAAVTTAVAATAEQVSCPRCGHDQPMAAACGLCKMDLQLHLLRLQRKAAMAAKRKQMAAL